MKQLVILFLFAAFVAISTDGQCQDPKPSIQSNGKWTKIHLMDADRLTIDYITMKDGSVLLSIIHFYNRDTEKPVTILPKSKIKGFEIENLGNGPQIGYAKGNLELSHNIYRFIPTNGTATKLLIPKDAFSHIPKYFKYVLPYPVEVTTRTR